MFFGLWFVEPIIIIIVVFFLIKRYTNKKSANTKPGLDINFNSISEIYFALAIFSLTALCYSIIRMTGKVIDEQTVLLVTFGASAAIAYTFLRQISLAIMITALPSWWAIQGSKWATSANASTSTVFFVLVAYLAILFMVGKLHESLAKYRDFSRIYTTLSFIPATLMLFILSTNSGINLLREFSRSKNLFSSMEVTVIFLLALIASLGLLVYAYSVKKLSEIESISILIFLLIFLATVFFPPAPYTSSVYGYSSSKYLAGDQLLWAVVFNLAIFAEVLILIFLGYTQKRAHLINIGSVLLFLLIITKYFDWFFSFIDKSIFFIGAGCLLLALGYFMEKGRRYMLSTINTTTNQPTTDE